ncbi:dynein axonemal intermediate chain 1-like isoform X1 [Megalobrama amblycephala]|uniref:dynein axonemal intermediate chain 1-like isoform X1 n=1 Tax=Megalobrama amblycephala TaxID=75352 RepID=UPI002014405D|nr:dynein axonemal intermediate chain 1-like isoform X1 [Megalobrama amblycephala]
MASEPDTKMVVYATFSANASLSIIYDCYVEELKRWEKLEKEGKKREEKKEDWKYKEEDEEEEEEEEEEEDEEGDEEEKDEEEEEDEDTQECAGPSEEKDLTWRKLKKKDGKFDVSQIAEAVWMMERAVVNNIYADIRNDFMYFEDPADEFRGEKGTLLPLWKFQYDKAKGLSVTALCWSTEFNDLFAVGLGSYGYPHEDPGGMLLFYTTNMHTFPEFIFETASGVMCVDIHKSQGHLVAVGFHDGCVAVYSLLRKQKKPIYNSRASSGKHRGPVMQVKWQKDDLDSNHNFFSVSADGRVVSWTLRENELVFKDIIKLPAMDKVPDDLKDEIPTPGISLDFNKKYEFLYLLASQSGTIYKGSIYTSSTFLDTYDAHFLMSVMCVRWNPFHSRVFISCGMDWMVKIWNEKMNSPVFTFDLRAGVTDVAWAPYSSTVFAAVTTDGKVHVFDLRVNKYEALCQQVVMSKKKTPVKIEFNPVHPIIIVGDDRGHVISLKLSPNLRKKPKDKNGQELPNKPEEEMAKIEQLLSLRR